MRVHLGWIAGLLTILLTVAACGGDGNGDDEDESVLRIEPSGIEVRDAWIRPAVLPQGRPTPDPDHADHGSGVISAMYLTIENSRSQSIQLTGVQTEVAGVIEMHETQIQNGLARMRPVEAVDIPAGGEVAFEPGGLHIMLIDINRPLEPGDEVAVTLIFQTGERYELPAVPIVDA